MKSTTIGSRFWSTKVYDLVNFRDRLNLNKIQRSINDKLDCNYVNNYTLYYSLFLLQVTVRKDMLFTTVMRIVNSVLFIIILLSTIAFGEVEEYILQPGDVISINVVEHPEFSGRHKIRPDGRINYPVIGEVDVASLTCAQLVKILQGKLSSYVNNPVVSISIEAYYANKIFIIGDVIRAGEFEIYEPVDIIKAIAMCGGLKNPKSSQLKIIRADGTIINISVRELWGTGSKRDNRKYILYPGDTMYAPESFVIPWGLISTILGVISSSIALTLLITSLGSR